MFRHALAALVLTFAAAPPAAAQEITPAQGQALLADYGGWVQDYNTALTRATAVLLNIESFVQIMQSVGDGTLRERQGLRRIEDWRTQARREVAAARALAQQLRPPPSMAVLGERGASIDAMTSVAHETLLPTIDQIGQLAENMADLGVAAIRNPEEAFESRARVLYNSTLQMVRIDRQRIDVARAAMPPDHPNARLMAASALYYDVVSAFATHELARLDGDVGDRVALAAALRRSASNMVTELNHAEIETRNMRESLRFGQTPEMEPLITILVRMLETFPASIREYRAIATQVDRAARRVEAGEDTLEVWGDFDEAVAPNFVAIERHDVERARLTTAVQGSL